MNTTSTRSSPPNADILSQHDANVQKRFRRALLCSLVVNVVALGAFALSKTAPIAEIEAAQTPMQWTISTTSRSFSMPDANTSSTRTANNASGERISRAVFRSSPRRENLQRESSRAENTSFETRRNTEPRDKYRAPRRVLMPENRGETKTSSQNALSAREQNTTVSGAVENRYPLEHSDHSPHNFPTMTSRTRSRASRNTTSSNAHASSAGNGASAARSQNAGLIRGALNTNDNSSSNNATSDFSRSSSGKVQSDKSSQNAPPQNARDESSRESSTRGRESETVSQDEPRITPTAARTRPACAPR